MSNYSYLSGYICHSFVCVKTDAPLFFNTHSAKYRKSSDEEANRAFFTWMANESPVRNFILNKDTESLCEGGAILDCQRAGPSVILWICKAFRCATEEMWRIPLWHKLVKGGVHPMLAMCVSHCATESLLLQKSKTHCSVFDLPKSKADVNNLLTTDHLPNHPTGLKDTNYHMFETSSVFPFRERSKFEYDKYIRLLDTKGRIVKEPDGWGGFTEKCVGATIEGLIADLIKLQEECK